MNDSSKKIFLFCLTLALIGGTAYALAQVKANRRLGNPGVKAVAVPGGDTMTISLPENVLDFTSTNMPTSDTVLGYLPKDTSYAERIYIASDRFEVLANLILMGADRTSIHRPDYCLPGQGLQILSRERINIPVAGTPAYELPVQAWKLHGEHTQRDGQRLAFGGIYVFWFVAENNETDDYGTIQKSILLHLIRHGVLERWAYASYYAECQPGQEDAILARVKNLIANSVAEFQLPPKK
jgi:hypothetical protein